MHKIFCSAEKSIDSHSIQFKENIIEEWPHNWSDGEISYRLNNFSDDHISERNQLRAVTVALRVWQLRINKLKFRRERSEFPSVDFQVSFHPTDHFSSNNVFAHAYFPGQGEVSGDVHINDESWDWVSHSQLMDLAHPPLVPILIHEFGHSLGLRHDTRTQESIMYPSFNLGRKKNKLHEFDVERIQDKYGVRNISQRIIDYFRRRRDAGWDF